MPGWAAWIFVVLGIWFAAALLVALLFGGISALVGGKRDEVTPEERSGAAQAWAGSRSFGITRAASA